MTSFNDYWKKKADKSPTSNKLLKRRIRSSFRNPRVAGVQTIARIHLIMLYGVSWSNV